VGKDTRGQILSTIHFALGYNLRPLEKTQEKLVLGSHPGSCGQINPDLLQEQCQFHYMHNSLRHRLAFECPFQLFTFCRTVAARPEQPSHSPFCQVQHVKVTLARATAEGFRLAGHGR
jgi:hypothetical protein